MPQYAFIAICAKVSYGFTIAWRGVNACHLIITVMYLYNTLQF